MRKKEQQEIIQIMNILFFLTPKEDVAHVDEDDTMRQVLEKMEHHGYTAIPLLSREGKYIGTITEGDLLWFLKDRNFPDLKLLEDMPITSIQRRRDNEAVKIDESMEDLFGKVMNQNFVPVVDDKRVFIGIVTRKDILAYLGKKAAAQENGARGMPHAAGKCGRMSRPSENPCKFTKNNPDCTTISRFVCYFFHKTEW
jgi:CBS domain-containing protein